MPTKRPSMQLDRQRMPEGRAGYLYILAPLIIAFKAGVAEPGMAAMPRKMRGT